MELKQIQEALTEYNLLLEEEASINETLEASIKEAKNKKQIISFQKQTLHLNSAKRLAKNLLLINVFYGILFIILVVLFTFLSLAKVMDNETIFHYLEINHILIVTLLYILFFGGFGILVVLFSLNIIGMKRLNVFLKEAKEEPFDSRTLPDFIERTIGQTYGKKDYRMVPIYGALPYDMEKIRAPFLKQKKDIELKIAQVTKKLISLTSLEFVQSYEKQTVEERGKILEKIANGENLKDFSKII